MCRWHVKVQETTKKSHNFSEKKETEAVFADG